MKSNNAVKYILLGIFTILFGVIVWPFLPAIVFALIFTITFYPLFKLFTVKLKMPRTVAAILVLLITLIFILAPLALFFGLVGAEAYDFIRNFDENTLWEFFDKYSNFTIFGFEINLDSLKAGLQDVLKTASQKILNIASETGKAVANFSFQFFVFLFLYAFFLIDSEKLLKATKTILPFDKKQNEILMKDVHHVSKTVFLGNVTAAVISGIIAYIGFTIVGIPGALIWALLAGLLSLIPTVGAMIVYLIGAVIAYFVSGFIAVLILVGYYIVVEAILLQGVIKPKLVDEKITVHPILVFFSLIGGIHAFGSIGIIYGPLIVVLFVSMYKFILGTQKNSS
jgi:predicted PurR-regulated permease PerM